MVSGVSRSSLCAASPELGATVPVTGGLAAREVLTADAANLPSAITAPAKEGIDVPAARRSDGVKSTRERAEEKRAEKLAQVREQVESGTLVIRPMTDEERKRYPPRPDPVKRPGRG
jgi:hypothetical protein